jgi:hypothetical protein
MEIFPRVKRLQNQVYHLTPKEPKLRISGSIPPFLLHVFVAWTETTLLYPVYSSLVSLERSIVSICFIRHSQEHTESQNEHTDKSLPHKSIRNTRSLKIFFIVVVSETKCGTAVFNGPIVHLRMIVLVKCLVG